MNANGLKYAFDKLSTFLGLKNKPDIGLTIIVSPQWIFVATLSQEYHVETKRGERDFPVFLDGFAFAGIMNLQTI